VIEKLVFPMPKVQTLGLPPRPQLIYLTPITGHSPNSPPNMGYTAVRLVKL
jgi:hypothetical protein